MFWYFRRYLLPLSSELVALGIFEPNGHFSKAVTKALNSQGNASRSNSELRMIQHFPSWLRREISSTPPSYELQKEQQFFPLWRAVWDDLRDHTPFPLHMPRDAESNGSEPQISLSALPSKFNDLCRRVMLGALYRQSTLSSTLETSMALPSYVSAQEGLQNFQKLQDRDVRQFRVLTPPNLLTKSQSDKATSSPGTSTEALPNAATPVSTPPATGPRPDPKPISSPATASDHNPTPVSTPAAAGLGSNVSAISPPKPPPTPQAPTKTKRPRKETDKRVEKQAKRLKKCKNGSAPPPRSKEIIEDSASEGLPSPHQSPGPLPLPLPSQSPKTKGKGKEKTGHQKKHKEPHSSPLLSLQNLDSQEELNVVNFNKTADHSFKKGLPLTTFSSPAMTTRNGLVNPMSWAQYYRTLCEDADKSRHMALRHPFQTGPMLFAKSEYIAVRVFCCNVVTKTIALTVHSH
jgi:hypothetical protein